jgi:DNA-binding PadR family transcriptional regulator
MMRHLLLGLLRHRGPRHGYALMKTYRDSSGRRLSIGNIYRELQRLASEGLVRSAPNPPDADPRRIPYEITSAGAERFDAWLARSAQDGADGVEDEHLLKAFFVVRVERSLAARVLEHWEEELTARRRLLERARHDALERAGKGDELTSTLPLWLGRRLRHVAVDLEFVGEVRAACNGVAAVASVSSSEQARSSTYRAQRSRRRSRA